MEKAREETTEVNDFAFRKAAERVLERFAEAYERAEEDGGRVALLIEVDMTRGCEEPPREESGRAMRWPWKRGGRA